MSSPRSLLRALAEQLGSILDPLTGALQDHERMEQLLARLGVFDSSLAGPVAAFHAVQDLRAQLETLAKQDDLDYEAARVALQAARAAFDLVDAVSDLGSDVGVIPDLGRDLLDYLFETWLLMRHPLAREVMALLTLLEAEPDRPERPAVMRNGEAVRAPVKIDRVRLDRLPALLRDPVAVLKARYVNALATDADVAAMADRLFPQIVQVLRALGVQCHYGIEPEAEGWLGDTAPLMHNAMIIYAVTPLRGTDPEAGIVVALSPASRGDLGLVISPFGTISFTKQLGRWLLQSTLSGRVDSAAWGRHGLTLLAQDAEIGAEVTASTPTTGTTPAYVFGKRDGTRVELGSVKVAARTTLSLQKQSLALSADVSRTALVITPGDADGFLASLLPAQGLRTDVDLGIAWSSDTGLTLRGSGGLEATLPVHLSFGGLSLSHVHVGVQAKDAEVRTEVSATLGASIGPVRAVVDRVGVDATLTFPPRGGNLGVADVALGFKPPSGIGLTVEARGVLTGGGFLFHDRAQGAYAGAMQLSLRDQITLKAFGLIATRMPDGSRGYSLLVFIAAEDFRPIPLGLGFTLLGIGGMVGVNRTFDENVLRAGLKSGTLATLLYPRDPVGNASTLIRNLSSAFPAYRGSHLLGLIAKIGWFTPTLITMDLALILEFGSRQRLLALGRISALLPSADNDLVRLHMEAVGVIDFDAGTAAIDAELVDSRLVHKFPITGSAALRTGFGEGPSFVLSIGGFNPRFAAPATVPALNRVTIALSSGNNPRLVCQAYFAITSNTVQFGADASLYASAAGFSVDGNVGFDVLVQLAPLHFIADFHAKLQLKRGPHNLFGVKLNGSLEGPRPLRVSGKATFEILWCDFSVSFDTTLVKGEKLPLPPAVNVLSQLTLALASPSSWSTQRSATQAHGVALRSLPPGPTTGPIVLDPLGQVMVKQQVVPLNTARDIDTFGGAPVAGARRFAVTAALNGTPLQTAALRADFASAQFFSMSDDEKLAAPSFESMDAGCVFGDANTSFDPAQIIPAPLEYQHVPITLDGVSSTAPGDAAPAPYTLNVAQLQMFSKSGAAARAPIRRVGRARFRNESVTAAARFTKPDWTIEPNGDGPAATVDAGVRTFSEYQAALKTLNRGGARWHLIPTREIED